MKKNLLLLMMSVLLLTGNAQTVITNPYYELTTTSIDHISKIELGKKETKVTLHTIFIPNWWITISDSSYIEIPETKERLYVKSLSGTEFNTRTFMPASGDSSFILTFPPLSKKVKTINYHSNQKDIIYGISLDQKHPKRVVEKELPEAIQSWFDTELADAAVQEPLSLESLYTGQFFTKGAARLIGYFKGYDRRLGFETGKIYLEDDITNETLPLVIPFQADGRFEVNLNLDYPQYLSVSINNQYTQFYIEPGQTLAVVLDWEEFLFANRNRNKEYEIKNQYKGPLAATNRDLTLANAAVPMPNPYFVYKKGLKMSPEDFEKELRNHYESYRKDWEKYRSEHTIDPKAQAIKAINMDYEFASRMYEYSMRKERSEEYKDKFPLHFYNFLQEMPLDNQLSLLSTQYGLVLNRFEFMPVFRKSSIRYEHYKQKPEKTMKKYFKEKGRDLSEKEDQFLETMYRSMFNLPMDEEMKMVFQDKEKSEERKAFHKKESELLLAYMREYVEPLETYPEHEKLLRALAHNDSLLQEKLNLTHSFTYEVVKMRALRNDLNSMKDKKEEAVLFLNAWNEKLTVPYFVAVSKRIFSEAFPNEEKKPYALPEGDKGAELFHGIIDKYKGKTLFIDFWATSCGPCVSNIKETQAIREKYKDHPDFEFIFITDETSNNPTTYTSFIKEHSMYHSYSLKEDDMNYLRQLFKFTGIPRYVKVDKEGRIVDDNYRFWHLEKELEETAKNE